MAFEIAVTSSLLLLWSVLLGHFEAHVPRWRILTRCVLTIAVAALIGRYAGRDWFWFFIVAAHLPAAYVHLWWLPRRGVNGWTGEPRELYESLVRKRRPL
jgi:hypothetical protein